MKFTIEDTQSDDKVKLDLLKHPRNKSLTLVFEESKEKILEVSATNGKLNVGVDHGTVTVSGLGASQPQAAGSNVSPLPADLDAMRNWKTEGDRMEVYHPATGIFVELPILPVAAPQAPSREEPDILGQPEMTFAVAYAMHKRKNSMLVGPTGTGKTSTYRWYAQKLGYNFVICPIARGTEASHMVGDYMPVGQALFEWMDGPVTEAIRLSQQGPTFLVFDEINRIGNIAEFARVYSVLDDTRVLKIPERRDANAVAEVLEVGDLFIGATANPSDDEMADYVGVQDIDPALSSRFGIQPDVKYPPPEVELEALLQRVGDEADRAMAHKMVVVANRIREAPEVRFPISFRELHNWLEATPVFGYMDAAKVCVINKAPRTFHTSIENIIRMQG